MALSVTIRLCILASALTCISLGTAYKEEDVPYEEGAAGGVPDEEGAAGGGGGGGVPDEIGSAGAGGDPAQIVAKALLCFNDKYIYSRCEEEYRLTESGDLNVSPDHTDQYCSGPCLSETYLVLHCVDNILAHFLFYNRATIRDVRDTIKAGCGYGPERGNFDVSEHIEAEEGSANKVTSQLLVVPLVVMIIGRVLLH